MLQGRGRRHVARPTQPVRGRHRRLTAPRPSARRIDSTPLRRFAQNSSTEAAPGKRPAIPTMTTSSRNPSATGSPRRPCALSPQSAKSRRPADAGSGFARPRQAAARGAPWAHRAGSASAGAARRATVGIDAVALEQPRVAHRRRLGVQPVDHLRLEVLVRPNEALLELEAEERRDRRSWSARGSLTRSSNRTRSSRSAGTSSANSRMLRWLSVQTSSPSVRPDHGCSSQQQDLIHVVALERASSSRAGRGPDGCSARSSKPCSALRSASRSRRVRRRLVDDDAVSGAILQPAIERLGGAAVALERLHQLRGLTRRRKPRAPSPPGWCPRARR